LSFSEKNGIIAKIVDTKEVKKRSVHIFVEKRKERKMGKIKVESCEIEGLKVITPTVFGDERGYFMETYNYNDFKEAGIDVQFVQDNQSASKKGVLRGLHFQINYPQDKLVRVVNGEVFDVAVDLREGSKTYGKWFGVLLSAENKKQFFIPKNFAHGFIVLSDYAEFAYKCTDFYHPNDEGGLKWDDPEIGAEWLMPEGMKKEDCLNDIYGSPAGKEEDPEKWQEFLEFNNHQLKELMSNYGTVDLLWFDGDWERSAAQWKMPEFREYLHTLNPNVVLNSRMQGYGDYETPEQGIPLYGPKGEWEFCTTINDSWGYRPSDNDYKSSGQIVRMFCHCITLGGRMLLDIGPKEDGTLDERQAKVLLDLGGWIHDHKEAVFGTEKGLDYNHFLGGSTISADKKTMYLFVYDKPQETLCVKGIKTPVKKVTVLHTGEELRFSYTGSLPWSGIPGTLWIWAGEMSIHPFATIVKVELEDEITYNLGHGEVVTFNE